MYTVGDFFFARFPPNVSVYSSINDILVIYPTDLGGKTYFDVVNNVSFLLFQVDIHLFLKKSSDIREMFQMSAFASIFGAPTNGCPL